MCTIGCMYREQPSRAARSVQQQQSTSPRRSRSRSACWYAKMARAAAEGGRHRDRDVQQHVHAGWLTGKMREGLHNRDREGPSQTTATNVNAAGCWLPWDGRRCGRHLAGLRCAAHHAWPAYTYSLSLLYLNLNLDRRRRLLQPCGLIRRPGLVGETLRQARKRRMVSGKR